MGHNLAELPKDEMDKINVDLAASGVAFKERYNMPVVPDTVEKSQLPHLREYFQQRLQYYRQQSRLMSRLPYEPRSR
ncbi:DNA polymerase III subunit theta [Xenorhabdus mauleonii]|uniref:DNA polymerase III subunit theta n=1 Tax=Xenorhabdus mauleonii TaxID=351675 RepID=A0A1I3NA27_9GAMM|nr:DNA polymerase III subunit theta [Xenorhabdus mauleonii]PHM45736.1 DNA polymerase III subunit theta [Xenorhabdus mauleonii]SFJ05995.1 DNA polymerase III, theta subunit [Xenorhabdus mauleonii]